MASPKTKKVLELLLSNGYKPNHRVAKYLEELYILNLKNKPQLDEIKIAMDVMFGSQAEAMFGHTISHGLFFKYIYGVVSEKTKLRGFLIDAIRCPSEPILVFLEKTPEAKEMLSEAHLEFGIWKPKRMDRFLTNIPRLLDNRRATVCPPNSKLLKIIVGHSVD